MVGGGESKGHVAVALGEPDLDAKTTVWVIHEDIEGPDHRSVEHCDVA